MPKRALPATNADEHQYWAEPILSAETRARLEYFRSLGYLPPNYKPKTLQGIAVVERYWRRYCDHIEEDYQNHLTLEDPAVYMSFFDWMWKSSKKKLLQSYDEYWRRLNQYFSLFERRPMSNHVLQQIRRFLDKVFPAERGVSRRAKRKETLTVEEYGLFQRYWWKFSFYFRCGNMIVQQSTVMLWSSISGSRPGVLLPEVQADEDSGTVRKRRRQNQTFVSDVPQYVSGDDMPKTVCYEDIELFYLRNPDGGKDVLCAIINFRNLKGRPEGADGTKFFMHCDYLLPYCPILHIVTMAFRDNAFENKRLTPEIIWRLRVPRRLPSLPLRWKKDKLRTPVLRRMQQTANGFEVHPFLPMTYDHSNMALKHIGEGLGYEMGPTHYNFRRWAANEVNHKYVQSERMRILGQSGNAVFEKHYQDSFFTGLQEVVLLRPSQAALCNEARKNRNRDPLAPQDLSDEQLAAIAKDPRILKLRQKRIDLKNEMRSLAGTVEAAKDLYPELYQEHERVCKKLPLARKSLKKEAKKKMRDEYYDNMPVVEVDKQIDRLIDDADTYFSESEAEEEDWELPTPDYLFEERARIVEAFYGPDAETLDGEPALIRRIQVTKDMVALCGLWEPSRRGRRFNWNKAVNDYDDEDPVIIKTEDDSNAGISVTQYPTDVCIVCERKFPRIDSLRRHLIYQHLALVNEDCGINCTQDSCKNKTAFNNAKAFLNHAATCHMYDLKITLQQLDRAFDKSLTQGTRSSIIGSTRWNSRASSETDRMSNATTLVMVPSSQTPTSSSVESDIISNIDPVLVGLDGN